MANSRPATIFVEEAKILDHQACPGNQYTLRLHAPKCATSALPGSFVHLQCDPLLPMRRPFSIMRASPRDGWIELLFKCVGTGTRQLSNRRRGEYLSTMGPIGNPFTPHRQRPLTILIGGGVGIPPMIFLADQLRQKNYWTPLVLMGSEIPFPFRARPSRIVVHSMPEGVIAAMPLLEDWGIPSRLASLQGYAGCYAGYVTELASSWLKYQSDEQLQSVEIFACGPRAMLRAVADMSREYELPCQISLEEYMACAVGGCAGCAVKVNTAQGPVMKRICVDGPVFNAAEIF